MVVDQQWNFFFPKAYAPGPSQLWLCSGTLFPSSCRPGRPALFLDQDFNTQWHCIPLLSSHSSPEFSSSSSPCRVGQLAGPPASLSQFSAPKRFAVHLLTRCRDLARAGLPPPSCRVGRRRDPAVFGRLSSTSNRAQRESTLTHGPLALQSTASSWSLLVRSLRTQKPMSADNQPTGGQEEFWMDGSWKPIAIASSSSTLKLLPGH